MKLADLVVFRVPERRGSFQAFVVLMLVLILVIAILAHVVRRLDSIDQRIGTDSFRAQAAALKGMVVANGSFRLSWLEVVLR